MTGAADHAGIHCLSIPTPFAVGRVNTYLIEDDPLTLLDTGPNSGKALDALEQALATHGRRVEDLERIVISHQHIDHLGLVGILRRRSGAEVCALDVLAPVVREFRGEMETDDEASEVLMLRSGIPQDIVRVLRSMSDSFRAWGGTSEVDRMLEDGEELAFRDRTLRVLHRPGHSPTDTVFWDEQRRVLLAGDHLIKHISSNPLVHFRPRLENVPRASDGRPQSLKMYLASLAQTREMPAELVLSGHGEPITNHAELIDERVVMHQKRARRILRMVVDAGTPQSPYDIAHGLWGNIAVTQAYLALSEVYGHLDLLLDADDVHEREGEDGVVRFEATR